MSITTKVTVALDSMGQVVAASRPSAQSEVTSGMVSDLGQTVVEIEVSANVADMGADKFLAHLAEHASIRSATAHLLPSPSTSGQEVTSGSI